MGELPIQDAKKIEQLIVLLQRRGAPHTIDARPFLQIFVGEVRQDFSSSGKASEQWPPSARRRGVFRGGVGIGR